ncbi:Cytochrome P450, B-class [Fusarium oxysporum f. sp. vasinfectum]|nr:Cytochrome P450, B-class [Fusarium oxysporum f. sp. vasinfectum]
MAFDPHFPFSRQHGADPAPEFQERLTSCPVARVELWDKSRPWLVVKHEDVREVLTDIRLSKNRQREGFPEMSAGGKAAAKNRPTFVDMDPPEHMHQRQMVAMFFKPEYVERRKPWIRGVVQHYLNEFINARKGQNSIDLIEHFALRVPSHIIYEILGVPLKDVDYLTQCNATRTNGSATASAAQDANIELLDYFSKLVDKKIESPEPSNDVIGSLVSNELANGQLDKKDVVQLSFLLLVAGNLTMINMIALGVITLLEHPDQLDVLIRDPSLSKPFVEELCRYHTASSFATRRVAKEVKAGEGIIASNQAANRDLDVFPDPNVFDMFRKRGSEEALGFGWGDHRCIAESLARAELEAVFSTLFQTIPTLKLAIPSSEIKWSAPTRTSECQSCQLHGPLPS